MSDANSRGFLYIAMSDVLEEAMISAKSLKNEMPDEQIALITDSSVDSEYFDKVIEVDDPEKGYGDKPKFIQPIFDKTIYLDTDIYFMDDVSELFALLDNFDIAAAHDHDRTSSVLDRPDSFPQFNTGVIAMRDNGMVSEFLEEWKLQYEKSKNIEELRTETGAFGDQPSFCKSLYDSEEIRFSVLPSEYNVRFDYPGYLGSKAKILHGRLKNIDTNGVEKKLNFEEVESKINKVEQPRVHYMEKSHFKVKRGKRKLTERILSSLERKGIKNTILISVEKLGSKLRF